MKVSKAIEILIFEDHATLPPRGKDFWDSIKLGIEALKRIEQCRAHDVAFVELPLPGETNED